MARKVFVTSDMAHDERLIEVAEENPQAALLWPWFITYFDDWGRADAHAKRIKAQLFPMNELVTIDVIEEAIDLFEQHGLIITYTVNGKRYMAIPQEKWWRYQTHIHRSKRENDQSRYPAPPIDTSRESPRNSAESREDERDFAPSPSPSPSPSPTPSPTTNTHDECVGEGGDGDRSVGQSVRQLAVRNNNDEDVTIQDVAARYRERIGIMGPSIFYDLQSWISEYGVSAGVLMAAIDRTADAREAGRIRGSPDSYLRGVIRQMYNDGVRTVDDLRERDRSDPRSADYDPIAVIRAKVAQWEREHGGDDIDEGASRTSTRAVV